MSLRAVARLAWLLCALSLALTALSLLLLALNLSYPDTHFYDYCVDCTVSVLSYAPIGALIAARRPANPVGWLLCLGGVVLSIEHFSAQYAIYALLGQPGSLPAGEALAWIASWILHVAVGLLVFSFLLFPTGRLPSRRWRRVAWLTVAILLVDTTLHAFGSGPIHGLGPIRNPLGIEDFSSIHAMVLFVGIPLYLAVASSPFVRLRRATGVERQQIKWFAYAVAATIGGIILYMIPNMIETSLWFERAVFALNVAVTPAIPIAIGIAIFRYRLYDIDLIINRTLVYGALTVVLAGIFKTVDAALHYLLVTLAHVHTLPGSIIGALIVGALFHPVKHRIQRFVDGYLPSEEKGGLGHSEEANTS